jgi:hypothetical protein
VTDSLDIVAVRVADERAVVAGVILRPDLRLVEYLRPEPDRGVEERADGGTVGRPEREVCLAETLAGGTWARVGRRTR